MVAIAAKEGLQLDNNAAEILVEQMGNDIRQVINCLQVYIQPFILYTFLFYHSISLSYLAYFRLIFLLFSLYFGAVVIIVDVACSE